MRLCFAVVAAAALLAGVASGQDASQSWTLTRAQWPATENARDIVALAPVRAAVRALSDARGARLVVLHNGGEDGDFWASDLEGWLIALGVPARRIVDRAGALPPGELRLRILSANEGSGP